MEENNSHIIIENNDKSNPLAIFIAPLLILGIIVGVFFFVNKDKDKYIDEEPTNNEIELVNNNEQTLIEENTTIIESNNTIETNDEDNEDDSKKELIYVKDKDYEYSYYNGTMEYDEDEGEYYINDYDKKVMSFKINDKEKIEDMGFTSEITEVKKYKDFLVIETYNIATCGPDSSDFYIYDYKGNLLYSSESISILDLKKLTSEDSGQKWDTGVMKFDEYKYDENSKILEIKYEFNMDSVIGDCVEDVDKNFCKASKNKTIYNSIKITLEFSNGKFTNEKVIEKNLFDINKYDEYDQDMYHNECD